MKKHTILFLSSHSAAGSEWALDREAHAIHAELERTACRDRFELVTRWAVEPLDLLRELRRFKPTVVHFSGTADPRYASAAALRQALGAAGASVKLVVLTGCDGEPDAEALLEHVECIVGLTDASRADVARSFAIGFYGALGERESVAAAYRHGRAAIGLEGRSDGAMPQFRVRAGVDPHRLVLADRDPGLATSARAERRPARPRVDVAILTSRDDELRAALHAFPRRAGVLHGTGWDYNLRHADAGNGERYTVAILRQPEHAVAGPCDAARELVADIAPRLVLLVGIARGLPSDDLRLGDVVVSTRIDDFMVEQWEGGQKAMYAATVGGIDRTLAAAVANLPAREDALGHWTAGLPLPPGLGWTRRGELYGPLDWQRELRIQLERHHGKAAARRSPIYVTGPIASSAGLLADPALLFPWIATARNLVAVETESGGAFRTARELCPMLAIRGISDIIGWRRADAWAKFACASAAAFARAFLRTRPVALGSALPDHGHGREAATAR